MRNHVCLVGPPGVGKTSKARRIIERMNYALPTVVTTRSSRDDDGKHYTYVSPERFRDLKQRGTLLEWDEYNNSLYGTVKPNIYFSNNTANGVVFNLTPDGCRQVRDRLENVIIICLLPDDPSWLKSRLKERGSDSPEEIKERTEMLEEYIAEVRQLDAVVVECNYDPNTWDRTFEEIVDIIQRGT